MSFGDHPVDDSSSATGLGERSRIRGDAEHPVSGLINRVKVPDRKEQEVVVNDPSMETIMISIDSARKLVDLHNETASTYFRSDQTIISTTTVHDHKLRKLDWQRELDIVRRFGPDYHIPTEYSVYQSMPPIVQARAILDCMEGTEWMAERLQNHSTSILVQAKGWKPWHYALCQPTIERLERDLLVFYAAGYKAGEAEPKQDIMALIEELHPAGILIIGKQTKRFMKKMPPEIVAAAGGAWRRKCGHFDGNHDPRKHSKWKSELEADLGSGQAIIGSYQKPMVN